MAPISSRPDEAATRGFRLAALAVLVVGALVLLPPVARRIGPADSLIMATASSLAAGALLYAINRVSSWRAREMRGWMLISFGIAGSALSDVLYFGHEIRYGTLVFPIVADYIWFLAITFILIGLWLLPHARYVGAARTKLILDIASGVVSLLILVWVLYLAPLLEQPMVATSAGGEILASAFAAQDVLLLITAVVLTTRRGPNRLAPQLMFLSGAVALNVVANFAIGSLSVSTGGTVREFAWVNGLFIVSSAAYLLAAQNLLRFGVMRSGKVDQVSAQVVIAPYALVVGLIVAAVTDLVRKYETAASIALQLGTVIVAILIVARQSVAIRETQQLMERQRNELVASVSHELKTPLTAVAGFAAMLGDRWNQLDEPTRREFAGHIRSHSNHLSRVVGDLVSLARENLEQTKLALEPHRVAVLIEDATSNLRMNHGEFQFEVDAPIDMTVIADRDRLYQILTNMLTNAVKYGTGRVMVTARARHGTVEIAVGDDGPGVPAKWSAVIFERFERGAHRLDSTVPGTGLGLPIALALAKAHGGTISVGRSEALGGAEFVLTLPMLNQSEPAPAHP